MTSSEVSGMDAGSLREAYRVLMNEHQAVLASYESLLRQTVQLEQVLRDMVRCAQKQDWANKYPGEMAAAKNALAKQRSDV